MTFFWTVLIGVFGGITSGLFGVGGGLLFVPLLVIFLKFDVHTAVGTSLAVIVPTAIAALFRHGGAGRVDWQMALVISVFAVIGAWLGAGLCVRLNSLVLQRLFAVLMIAAAVRLFFKP